MQTFNSERKLIGEGKMAKVYLWNGFAYKCFQKGYPEEWIQYELKIQKIINQTELPTVKYHESEIPGSIKMDYIEGITLADRIRHKKYKDGLEDLFTQFLSIHKIRELDLPRLNPYLIREINGFKIDSALKELALSCISDIPDSSALCHLDYHFLNIMYAPDGYHIIDWISAKLGNPIYDFARTYIILYEYANRLSGQYLKMGKERCKFKPEELKKAIFVMTMHRLTEHDSAKMRELLGKSPLLTFICGDC